MNQTYNEDCGKIKDFNKDINQKEEVLREQRENKNPILSIIA